MKAMMIVVKMRIKVTMIVVMMRMKVMTMSMIVTTVTLKNQMSGGLELGESTRGLH